MLPKQKISRKYLNLLIPSILIIFVLAISLITVKEYHRLQKALIQKGNDISDLYAITLEKPIWYIDAKQIDQILDALLKDKEIVSIRLVVYTEDTSITFSKNEHLITKELLTFKREILHQTTHQRIGNITFYLTQDIVLRKIRNTILSFTITMVVLMITVILMSNLIQRKVIYHPILNLLDGINLNIKEKLYQPVRVMSEDEIGFLTESFNHMMKNLKEYANSLEIMISEREQLLKELRDKNMTLQKEISEHMRSKKQITIFRSFSEASGQGFGMSDLDGNITYINPALCRLLGKTDPDRIIGTNFSLYVPESVTKRMADVVLPALKREGQWIGESEILSMEGKKIPTLENIFLIRDESGKAQFIADVISDISARKQAEEEIRKLNEDLERRVTERTKELEASNKELESFSYSVSHDLRAPLRAIDGFSKILEEDYGAALRGEGQRYLNIMRENTHKMAKLIDDLLTFSRMSKQSVMKQQVSPSDIVRKALEELKPMTEGRQIEIKLTDLPICQADPNLLRVVFVNILSNAIKYTSKKELAVIEIGTDDSDEGTIYFVRDNGVGFDMRYVEKVFGVFQRLHAASDYEGTGIGLSFVQRIIIRHGGRIWATSEVDKGATFYFTLGKE